MSNVSNERWEGDLEADQLDDLAAHEGREDQQSAGGDIPSPGPVELAAGDRPSAGISNERWEGDLEADALDREAAEEGTDERIGDNADLM